MTTRVQLARPRRERDADVVTIDAVQHYLASVGFPRDAEDTGPYTLTMSCGMRVVVIGFTVSTRDRVSCSGCAQAGPPS